jgi:hypothetical protein
VSAPPASAGKPAAGQAALGVAGERLILLLQRRSRATPPRRGPTAWGLAQSGAVIDTACAGCFLLLRAALDARLPAIAARAGVGESDGTTLRALLVALGLRWSGLGGLAGDNLDIGLAVMAGLAGAPRLDGMATLLAASNVAALQSALLELLDGLRLLDGAEAWCFHVPLPGGGEGLVLGDGGGTLWPIGLALGSAEHDAAAGAELLGCWETATALRPALVAPAGILERFALAPPGYTVPNLAEAADVDRRYWEQRGRLLAELDALWAEWPGLPAIDLPLTLAAGALIHIWARWLSQGFAGSSAPYLLANAIRRPGRVLLDERGMTVELAPRPLDVVLQLAHYADDLELVPWLGSRRVRFRIGGR